MAVAAAAEAEAVEAAAVGEVPVHTAPAAVFQALEAVAFPAAVVRAAREVLAEALAVREALAEVLTVHPVLAAHTLHMVMEDGEQGAAFLETAIFL